MKFDTFKKLYTEAKEYENLEMYTSERGWQEWMESYPDANAITSVLTLIYTMSNGGVEELCASSHMKMKELANMCELPYSTIQRWKADKKIPERDKMLIAFAIVSNK